MKSPMLTSVLGGNVWYYVFRQQPQHDKVSQINYVIYFNKMGIVTDIKTSSLKDSLSLEEMNKKGISDLINIKHDGDETDNSQ
jgi:outer membrane protein assembly factor BamE